MADAVGVGVCAILAISQTVTLVLGSLALGGGTWLEDVRQDGDYFTRVQSGYNNYQPNFIGELHSMGMWRYFSEPGVSNPLPIRGQAGTLYLCNSLLYYIILFRSRVGGWGILLHDSPGPGLCLHRAAVLSSPRHQDELRGALAHHLLVMLLPM